VSAGFGAFAAKMAKAPEVLKATEREMVQAAALSLTLAERASLSTATHGTDMLRGVGRSGAKLSVGFDIKGGRNPTALVRAKGPWQFIENKTAAHVIVSRRGRVLAHGNKDGGPVASVNHPGTRTAKRTWQKGLDAGAGIAVAKASAIGESGMLRVFL
jgi:hypothetical protein